MGFRLVANIANGAQSKRQVAMFAVALLRIVVASNRLAMRKARQLGKPFPALYSSGVQYRREPWAGKLEEFADCETVLRRGWGDCDDLVAYRLAELLESGERAARPCARHMMARRGCSRCVQGADVRLYGRGSGRVMHFEVRRADGSVEDPSRFLGL